MSIINLDKTETYIINWVKDYANKAGIKTLVVGLSGGIDSALVALLCQKTKIPTICVNLPCHSSDSAWDRANNFAQEYKLHLDFVDLSNIHDTFMMQMNTEYAHKTNAINGLRSCLRAPALSFFALATNGIIIGTGNRSEDNLIRYFQKFGDGCVDICPIADLFKQEVYELFAHMTDLTNKAASDIYYATPTADLNGAESGQTDEAELGLSYDEIEWADRQNMRTNIVTDYSDPVKNAAWQAYTSRQRQVIAKMHALEKISRHKYNANLPVCKVREIPGLVI
jgi:NAD+ synthase